MKNNFFSHKRFNEQAGEFDYFFPMEIPDKSALEFAKANGQQIVKAKLGFRVFDAVEVPCVRQEDLDKGIRTPEAVQRHIYHELCRDELNAQEEQKENDRCLIPDAYGKIKRCPCRVTNPDYTVGGDQPKTLPVSCAGCKYEEYHKGKTIVNFSALDKEEGNGDLIAYEPAAPSASSRGDTVEKTLRDLIWEISEKKPNLKEISELYLSGYTPAEISDKLQIPIATTYFRISKIQKLAEELLDNMIIF